jgi:hypothetical protein
LSVKVHRTRQPSERRGLRTWWRKQVNRPRPVLIVTAVALLLLIGEAIAIFAIRR